MRDTGMCVWKNNTNFENINNFLKGFERFWKLKKKYFFTAVRLYCVNPK